MRILLIQAVSTPDGGETVFPLGLARLAAVIRGRHEVRGMDLNLDPFPWPSLVCLLETFQPQVVGISFRNLDPLAGNLISFVPQLKTLAGLVKRYASAATTVLGGSAFTLFARRLLAEVPEIDVGLAGEAEEIFPMLLDNLATPWTVPGVLWRTGEDTVAGTPGIAHCLDLNALPFPDWEIFDPRLYQEQNRYVASMGVETKRGCPNSCRYCLYPVLQGHGVRLRNPARVVDELEMLHRNYGICAFHFTDAVVNQPAGHLRAICQEILRRRLEIGWTGFFREDALTEQDVDPLPEVRAAYLVLLRRWGFGLLPGTPGQGFDPGPDFAGGATRCGQRHSYRLSFPGQPAGGDPGFRRSDPGSPGPPV